MSFAFRRGFTLTLMVVSPLIAAVSCGGTTTPSPGLDASGASGGPANDGGAGAGGAGAGGAGGAADASSSDVDAICRLPRESGNCEAYIPSYWHNPTTGVCEPFVYGGCGGNANRFPSLDECQAACHGGSADFDSCRDPGDCTLIAVGCCGNCGREVAHDFIAVNYSAANKYPRECNGTCGACPDDIPEKDLTGQYLTASCRAGACVVVDVRQTDATSCTVDSDCFLRDGLHCCEGCDSQGFVALNVKVDVQALTCGNEPIHSCPPCLPTVPANYVARCIASRCTPVVEKP